jgi:hypothetical protein
MTQRTASRADICNQGGRKPNCDRLLFLYRKEHWMPNAM